MDCRGGVPIGCSRLCGVMIMENAGHVAEFLGQSLAARHHAQCHQRVRSAAFNTQWADGRGVFPRKLRAQGGKSNVCIQHGQNHARMVARQQQ